jgi:hypothetical protein
MLGRQQAARRVGEDHGRHQPLREPADRVPGAGLQGAAAGPDQRPAGALERIDGADELPLVGIARRARREHLRVAGPAGVRAQQVRRHLDVHGPARRGHGLERRAGDGLAELLRLGHAVGPLHDRLEHRRLVGGLVQDPAPDAWPAQARRDVGGDHEDRLAARPRLADRGQRVGGAGAGGGERHAEPTGRARVAVGRVGGGLLVAHPDQPDRRFAQGAPERQVVHAGQAEGHVHAGPLQRRDRQAGACQDARPG